MFNDDDDHELLPTETTWRRSRRVRQESIVGQYLVFCC